MSQTRIPKALRNKVAAKARYRCGYCLTQEKVTGMPMDVDHLIPEALGGPTEEANLWLVCGLCNAFKSNRVNVVDPETGEIIVLFNPRYQIWSEHFRWVSSGEIIEGITSTGRATVSALQLNRELLVEARRLWAAVGWHPPND
jgi:hypothetical protein